MDNRIFIDTSFFKAIIDQKDEFHYKAIKIWESLELQKPNLITSNYVLDEAFTLIRARTGLKKVNEFRTFLAKVANEINIIRVTVNDEAKAWDWFLQNWQGLSFTDCVSFAIMKRLKINQVLTFDLHFSRAKFTICYNSSK